MLPPTMFSKTQVCCMPHIRCIWTELKLRQRLQLAGHGHPGRDTEQMSREKWLASQIWIWMAIDWLPLPRHHTRRGQGLPSELLNTLLWLFCPRCTKKGLWLRPESTADLTFLASPTRLAKDRAPSKPHRCLCCMCSARRATECRFGVCRNFP